MARRTKRNDEKKTKTRPRSQWKGLDRAQLLEALAPAGAHLFTAATELIAAASSAIEAFAEGDAGPLPPKAIEALTQAKASLALFATIAQTGAAGARSRARDAARREALAEILGALDARAERLRGPERETLLAVRDAVASGLGASSRPAKSRPERPRAPESRHGRVKKGARRLRRIPIVLDRDDGEE